MARELPNGVLVGAVLVAAALFALAAVLLVGTPGSAPGSPGTSNPSSGEVTIELPLAVWGLLFLSPLIVGLGAIIYRRLTEPGVRSVGGAVIGVLVLLLLYVLLMHGSGGTGSVSVGPPPPPPANNTTGGGGSSGGGGGGGFGSASFHLSIPPYVPWLTAGGLCVVVGLLALPGVVSRFADRARKSGGGAAPRTDPGEVAAAFSDARAALDRGADPRETIVRLYVRLLGLVAPAAGELAAETPEEIRQLHLATVGVPSDAATTLTRTFEEARYSTHPIDADRLARAQAAMRAAEAAIRRGATAG